jgi:hypothetical protein
MSIERRNEIGALAREETAADLFREVTEMI